MQDQIEILNKISNIMFESADERYDELFVSVEVDAIGRSTTEEATQKLGNQTAVLDIPSLQGHDLMMLSFDLHAAMKAHTGGDLKKYTVRIDSGGEATVDFEYHPQSG